MRRDSVNFGLLRLSTAPFDIMRLGMTSFMNIARIESDGTFSRMWLPDWAMQLALTVNPTEHKIKEINCPT